MEVNVIYHWQVTVSKQEANRGEGNKETGNDYAFLVFPMLCNCLKDSRKF